MAVDESLKKLDKIFDQNVEITGTLTVGGSEIDFSSFLTSFTETDPIFSASAAAGITSTNITNWDTAYGWGNHAGLYAASSHSHASIVSGSSNILVGSTGVTWSKNNGENQAVGQVYAAGSGNSRFMFHSGPGKVNVYTDGEYYANEGNNLVIHTGNIGSYALTSLPSHTHDYVPERNRTDWNDSTVVNNVIGQLAWQNYGNLHTIFDASSGTSPSGTAVNNTNSTYAWSATYPTLMGWNGSHTYGVRVDSSRVSDYATSAGNADTVDGLNASSFLRSDTDTSSAGYIASSSYIQGDTVRATNANDALGISFRSTNEVISGEGWCTAQYAYNSNDGFLFLNRDSSNNPRPVFHIGGHNNADYAGYGAQDSIITLTRLDGTKSTGSAYAGKGLSNSSYYTNIIKTTAQTIFKDSQGSHVFDNLAYANGSFRAPVFYDSNDTNWWIDPNGSSSAKFRQFVQIGDSSSYNTNSGGWGARLNVTDDVHARIDVAQDANGMHSYWYAHTGQSAIKFGTTSAHGVEFVSNNSGRGQITSGGTLEWWNNVSAPRYYDYNDTGYYIDPASYSNIYDGNLELRKHQHIDLRSLDANTFYPITFGVPTSGVWCEVQVNLNTGTTPWSTHSSGFTLNVMWRTNGSGWGTTDIRRQVFQYHERFTSQTICGGIGQLYQSSREYIYLRGGGLYNFYSSRPLTCDIVTTATTYANQNIAPRTDPANNVWESFAGSYQDYSDNLYTISLYDRNNTGFYVDPSSTTNSLVIGGSINLQSYNRPGLLLNASGTGSGGSAFGMQQVTAEGWTGIFVDYEPYTGWGLYHDNPNNYFCVTSESSTGNLRSFTVPSRESGNRTAYEKIRLDQNNGNIISGGIVFAQNGVSSNYFKDYGDEFIFRTGSNTGTTRHLNLANTTADPSDVTSGSGISWGQRNDGNPYYLIYTAKENYNGNYTKLRLDWHTGVIIGAASTYGGTRFFNNSSFTGAEIASIGKGSNHVRAEYSMISPIYYDNDTGYFLDANSTSRFYNTDYGNGGTSRNGDYAIALGDGAMHVRSTTDKYHKMWYYDGIAFGTNYSHGHFRFYGETNTQRNASTGGAYIAFDIDTQNFISTAHGTLKSTGDILAYSSDARLKENVRLIENPLDKLKNIRGVIYDWKDVIDEYDFRPRNRKDDVGVIAQEVEAVLPQVVTLAPFDTEMDDEKEIPISKSGENYKTVQYEKLVPLLIEAVKELSNKVEDLENQLKQKS